MITRFWLRFAAFPALLCLIALLGIAALAPAVPLHDLLAYTQFNPTTSTYEIVMLDVRRGLQMPLALRPYQNFYGWSADGRFAFLSDSDMNSEVYLWDGLTYINISQHPMNDWRPSISPDGKVAFASERDGNMEIYVWEAGVLTNISQHPATDDHPVWSSDGRLAFVSTRDGVDDIIVWDGAAFINITQTPNAAELSPVWSPDGRLAFLSKLTGQWEIILWDGATLTSVDAISNVTYDLAWSSDGKLAYSDGSDIWVWDGGTPINISSANRNSDFNPTWRGNNTLAYVALDNSGQTITLWDGVRLIPIISGSSISAPAWMP